MNLNHCPLCDADARDFHQDRTREYFQCINCRLVFVTPEAFLSIEDEKARYDLHQNSATDMGYRSFLSRLLVPMTERLPRGSQGLDFGCGPGPTLSIMFEEAGYPMALYDPLYVPDESVLEVEYDFVTVTEVVEHLQSPMQTLNRIWSYVRPGGYLGIMTKLVIGPEAFAKWHYKNDDTHICFFSIETFVWLAEQWKVTPEFVGKDVIILQKSCVSEL